MDAISRVWYNGSYTIAAKRIKMLELHYTMIQFLIIIIIARVGDLQCIIPISLAFLHITLYSPKKKMKLIVVFMVHFQVSDSR